MELFYGILFSAHLGFQKDYNSIHPYFGRYVTDNIAIGSYYNSEKNISSYVGYITEHVEIGLVTGYSSCTVCPMVKFNYNNFFISPSLETMTRNNEVRKSAGIVLGFDWRM